jgi:hypothetical protein
MTRAKKKSSRPERSPMAALPYVQASAWPIAYVAGKVIDHLLK